MPIPQTPLQVGLNGSKETRNSNAKFEMTNLTISFKLTQTPIIRPHIDFNFIKNKRWRFPQGSASLSDGGMPPEGAMQAISTDIVLIKDLVISFDELKRDSSSFYKASSGSGGLSILGMNLGARVGGSKNSRRNQFEIDKTNGSITVDGIQIIGFRNQLLGKAPDPDPQVAHWITPDIAVS